MSAIRIRISTGFLPAPFCSQFQKSNNPHALNSNITATQTVRIRAVFTPPTASHSTVFAVLDSYAGMWREGDGFCQPAGKHTGNKCCDTNNRQAALRCTHHKFQAVARIEQSKEKNSIDKIGACQPVPHQRKGADKQAEKGQRMLRKVEQMLGNSLFLLRKIRYNAQMVTHSIMMTFAARQFDIHLIRDNRHGHNQAITYQTA